MLSRVIAFSIRRAPLVILASLLVVGLTVYALQRVPVDVFPELNAPTVVVLTEAGGLSAEEVEQYVSFPIESSVNGLPGLRRVRSGSSLGLSIVWAEFDWGVDIYRARQMVSERVDLVEERLPENVHLQMMPVASLTGEILMISLRPTDEEVDPLELRAFAEFDLRNRLLTVQGVSQVVAIGGWLPEYQVEFEPEVLRLHDLTAQDLSRALEGAHNLHSAGFLVDVDGRELPLRQGGRVEAIEDIEATVVAVRDGAPLTVGDVAEVRRGGTYRRGAASSSGESAVILGITKAPGTNTLAVTRRVDALLDQVETALPAGMALDREVMRQDRFIHRSIDNVTSVLYEATIIITVILVLFLMNLRTTLITLTALPVSLGAGLLILWASGLSLNVMTLGGLAVAIGILVDDAIIDVENVHRRLREHDANAGSDPRSRLRVIFDASNEIRSSIVFATVIICVVFVPLLFLQGLEGRFFRPLALTYIISVMASLVVAMTLTPALCRYLLRGKLREAKRESPLVRLMKAAYRPLLALCLRVRWAVVGLALLVGGLALWFASTFGSDFLPDFNEGTWTVFVTMPPGTSLDESERIALAFQEHLERFEGVAHVAARSGRAERDEHAHGPSNTEIEVGMTAEADPFAVRREIDAFLGEIPGVDHSIGQPISHRLSHVLSGTRDDIAINIFGEDLGVLREIAARAETELRAVPGTRDVIANRGVLVDTLAIDFRRDDLATYGLTPEEAGEQVRRAIFGETVAVINEGVELYDLVVRLDEDRRTSPEDVAEVELVGSAGTRVELHEVADVGPERAANAIARQNARRKLVISANVAEGHNLGDTVAVCRAAMAPILADFNRRIEGGGYTVEFGGQFQAQRSAARTILTTGILVLVLMTMLLQMALGGLRPALLVMINLPLALIGGIAAMFVAESDAPLANLAALLPWSSGEYVPPVVTIASLVGFITLFGIAVRNGILLVNHIRWLRAHEGLSVDAAVRRGGEERLVPVLMTALSAALGLLPLALRAGEPGSELLAPLAIVVLGGLVSSTLLNMLVVPAGYLLFCRTSPVEEGGGDDLPV